MTTESHFQSALASHQDNDYDEAERLYQLVLKQDPNHLKALNNLALIVKSQGEINRSIILLQKVIALDKNFIHAYNNLANLHLQEGDTTRSQELYEQALKLDPQSYAGHLGLGNCLNAQGLFKQAIKHYLKAIDLFPQSLEARNNLGSCYLDAGNFAQAKASLEYAIGIDPKSPESHYNLGRLYAAQGKLQQSLEAFNHTLELAPRYPQAAVQLWHNASKAADFIQSSLIEPTVITQTRQALKKGAIPALTPFLALLIKDSPALQHQVSKAWSKTITPILRGSGRDRGTPSERPQARLIADEGEDVDWGKIPAKASRPITVGYVSANFTTHPMGYLLKDIITAHDPKRIKAIAYALNPPDSTPLYRHYQKSMTFRDVSHSTISTIKTIVKKDKVDILVDLMGHTQGSRLQLFSTLPAPIQISWLGFPGTSGAPFIDYILTDPILTPPGKAVVLGGTAWGTPNPVSPLYKGGLRGVVSPHFTEKLLYLPHAIPCLSPRPYIPHLPHSRTALGLPEAAFIYTAPNDAAKITPERFAAWCRLLQNTPASILWLFTPHSLVLKNLRSAARQHGIAPNRILASQPMPFNDHIKRLALADLALDTHPYSGGATTAMCLAAGVPVVTQVGKTLVSRLSASLLHAYGLDPLITKTPKQYENLARSLATNPKKLTNLKSYLVNHKSGNFASSLTQTFLSLAQ